MPLYQPGGAGASDHGALTGLADDDHTAYSTNTEFDDHSARHEDGGADEISIAALSGTPVAVTDHLADTTDAHDASAVSFDDTGLGITATDVQTMGEQLDAAISAGGIPATIFDAAGDIIVASAADTAVRLAKGADGTFLGVVAGSVVYATPAGGSGIEPGQVVSYPAAFSGDTIDGSSTTPFVDVAAFDAKEVLNSRILHLRTLGASKDQRVRVTLGTTKAGAFDVTVVVVWNGQRWASSMDTYGEVRLSTAADAQLAIARYGMQGGATDWGVRVGGAAISTALDTLEPRFYLGQSMTLRFVRDGSDVISYSIGLGTAPMALVPIVGYNVGGVDVPYTQTVSGTLARIEFATHTPSGPDAAAAIDTYLDYLASV